MKQAVTQAAKNNIVIIILQRKTQRKAYINFISYPVISYYLLVIFIHTISTSKCQPGGKLSHRHGDADTVT